MKTYTVKAIYTGSNWMEGACEGELETEATGDGLFIEAEELVREWGFRPMRDGNILPRGEGGCYSLLHEDHQEIDWKNGTLVTVESAVIVITVWPEEEEGE